MTVWGEEVGGKGGRLFAGVYTPVSPLPGLSMCCTGMVSLLGGGSVLRRRLRAFSRSRPGWQELSSCFWGRAMTEQTAALRSPRSGHLSSTCAALRRAIASCFASTKCQFLLLTAMPRLAAGIGDGGGAPILGEADAHHGATGLSLCPHKFSSPSFSPNAPLSLSPHYYR